MVGRRAIVHARMRMSALRMPASPRLARHRLVALPALHGLRGALRSADPAARPRRLRRRPGLLSTPIPESAAQARDSSSGAGRAAGWTGSVRWRRWAAPRYYIVENPRLTTRMAMVDDPARSDVVVGRRLHRAPARGLPPPHRAGPGRPGAGLRGLRLRRSLAAGFSLSRRRGRPEAHRPADADDRRHLRHPHPGVGDVHLSLRRLRGRHVARRPPALLHGRRPRRGRGDARRRRQGGRHLQRPLRDRQRQRHRQRGDHRRLHDPAHDPGRLPAALRGGRGGVRVHGRPAHPAGHGRGRLHHGRDARRVVRRRSPSPPPFPACSTSWPSG